MYIDLLSPVFLFFQTHNDDDEDDRIDEDKYFVATLMGESTLAKVLPFTGAANHGMSHTIWQ